MLSPDHDHLPLLLPEDDVVRGGLITVAWLLWLLIFTPRITNTEEGVILLRQQTGETTCIAACQHWGHFLAITPVLRT